MRSSWPRSEWRLPSWVAHQLLEFWNLRVERMPTVENFNLKFKWVIRPAPMQADHLLSLGLWQWPATAWYIFLAVCVCAHAPVDAHFVGFMASFGSLRYVLVLCRVGGHLENSTAHVYSLTWQ